MDVNRKRAMTEVLENKVIRHQFKKIRGQLHVFCQQNVIIVTVLRTSAVTGKAVSILNYTF
jgi:hypothetical protein